MSTWNVQPAPGSLTLRRMITTTPLEITSYISRGSCCQNFHIFTRSSIDLGDAFASFAKFSFELSTDLPNNTGHTSIIAVSNLSNYTYCKDVCFIIIILYYHLI